ncbi:MAG: hypothetical protein JSW58_11010 [Candidatus Latescibacterota bacterium]|nr:MAG: hypothetical protein JSW58_11010 [Candidatus Latescibacterota bacterium]
MPEVKISCVDGDFSYSDQACYIERKHKTVQIRCEQGYPFAVHIGWNTPFEKGRDRAKGGETIYLHLKKDALPGEYKYLVAVYDPKTEEIWTDDPYFIIKP